MSISLFFCASHSTLLISYVSSGTFFHFQVLFPRSTCSSRGLIDTETMPGLKRHKGVSALPHTHAHMFIQIFLFFLFTPWVLFLKGAFVQLTICGYFSCANMFWSICLLTKGKTTRKILFPRVAAISHWIRVMVGLVHSYVVVRHFWHVDCHFSKIAHFSHGLT